MFRAALLVLLAVTSVQCNEPRIIGGTNTTIANHPYQDDDQKQNIYFDTVENRVFLLEQQMVSIIYNGEHICGGSLISNQWILTAAHCVYGKSTSFYSVRVGSTYKSSGGTVISGITSIICHEQYDEDTYDNDVAVIKLTSALTLSTTVGTISLANTSSTIATGTNVVVTGWGKTTSNDSMSETLQALTVPIIDQTTCYNIYIYYNTVTAQMICAGYTTGTKDTCQGDSGGPLVYNGVQFGIVSWGAECATAGYPGVYGRVSALRAWITKQTSI